MLVRSNVMIEESDGDKILVSTHSIESRLYSYGHQSPTYQFFTVLLVGVIVDNRQKSVD